MSTNSNSPDHLWSTVLEELRHQMTQATYDTWFTTTHVADVDGDHWTINTRTDYARDWLQSRLADTVRRTLASVTGNEGITVTFQTRPPHERPVYNIERTRPTFPGFESYQSNFVQAPKQFFEIVVPTGPSVVTALVAGIIDNTIGTIVNWHTGERRQWWEASHREIAAQCGMSPGSVGKAVRIAVDRGYIIARPNANSRKYRLRRLSEPPQAVDNL